MRERLRASLPPALKLWLKRAAFRAVRIPLRLGARAVHLAERVRKGDAVLVMGGGLSYRIATGLLSRLEGNAAR